jgi:hypothetical protein
MISLEISATKIVIFLGHNQILTRFFVEKSQIALLAPQTISSTAPQAYRRTTFPRKDKSILPSRKISLPAGEACSRR